MLLEQMEEAESVDDQVEERQKGKRVNCEQYTWEEDYLAENCTCPEWYFAAISEYRRNYIYEFMWSYLRRFRRVLSKTEIAKRVGHTSHQKMSVTLQWLIDDTSRVSEESIRRACVTFCAQMLKLYGVCYFNRQPMSEELKYAYMGFPAWKEALYYCKIHWKNCHKILKGQFFNSKDGQLAVISV